MDILIVEDSVTIRQQLRLLLAPMAGVSVVGEAESEALAIELSARLRPGLVLLDLSLTPGHGFNVLRHIRQGGWPCVVLVLTHQPLPAYRRLSEELGADGFYDKSLDIDTVMARVRHLAEAGG